MSEKLTKVEDYQLEECPSTNDSSLEMTPAEKRKLTWKIDLALLPFCASLFSLSAIDRINVGQAAVAGLLPDLKMSSTQYSIALSIFYITYTMAEIPSTVILKLIPPHVFITVIICVWSICTLSMGLCTDATGLIIARVFLGLAEGGLFPGISYMLSCWYTREQLSLRVSFFFLGATVAGGFGGILAFGLRQMNGIGGKPGWAWIFIIEGIITFIFGVASWWAIRDLPETSTLLDETERPKWIHHLRSSGGMTAGQLPFSWHLVFKIFKEWQLWVYCLMYIGIANAQFSLALFLPTIITGLGWTGSTANVGLNLRFKADKKLMSAPPWIFAFVILIGCSFWSDKIRMRGPFIIACMVVDVACFGVLVGSDSNPAKYAVLMIAAAATSCAVALGIAWIGGNQGPALTRAAGMGIYFAIGNAGGVIASNIYPSYTGPKYILGHTINLALCGVSAISAMAIMASNYYENRARDRKFGVPPSDGSDCSPANADDETIKAKYNLTHLTRDEIVALGHHHPAFRFFL